MSSQLYIPVCPDCQSFLEPFSRNRIKPRLVRVPGIRPLLDLDDLAGFQHLEPVPAGCQQQHVPGPQETAFQICSLVIVKIHAHPAGLDEQHLIGEMHFPRDRIVDVRIDDMTGRAAHVAKLLGKVAGGEKMDAVGPELGAQEYGQGAAVVGDVFDHFSISRMKWQ